MMRRREAIEIDTKRKQVGDSGKAKGKRRPEIKISNRDASKVS